MKLSLETAYDVIHDLWQHRLAVLVPDVGQVHLDLPPTSARAVVHALDDRPRNSAHVVLEMPPEVLAAGLRQLAEALDGLARKDAA